MKTVSVIVIHLPYLPISTAKQRCILLRRVRVCAIEGIETLDLTFQDGHAMAPLFIIADVCGQH